MIFDLPYPPTGNRYWRLRFGALRLSDDGKKYRRKVAATLGESLVKILGRIRLEIDVHAPDRRRRDLDNVLKSLLDAMTFAGVYEDDSKIDSLHVERGLLAKPGYVRVTVLRMEDLL